MPIDFSQYLAKVYFGNSVNDYLIALAIFAGAIIVLRIFKFFILRRLKKIFAKTETDFDDLLIDTIDKLGWPFYAILSLYFALEFIQIPQFLETGIRYLLILALVFYVVKAIQSIIDFGAHRWAKSHHPGEKSSEAAPVHLLARLAKGALWGIAIVLILANFGYDVSALLAGLGIGGIAIAFALQNILSDIFASFSIHFDKPFRVGDFIVIGDDMGVVKQIGIKSTILESLWGQDIIVSNKELTTVRINNYRTMKKRRVVFTVGVLYETPNKKLEKIPKIVKDIFAKIKLLDLDRVHFKTFAASSLDYEVAFYVDTGEYAKYMDLRQEVNLALKQKFEEEGIEFAYPTQTLYQHQVK